MIAIIAALVNLSGPVWPALAGTIIAAVAWLEFNR
jgi:hypothetical protein